MLPAQIQSPVELLKGRRAVVIAAAGAGIGFAVAPRVCLEGASVAVSDVHLGRLEIAAERLRQEAGAMAQVMPCDVREAEQVDALFAQAADLHSGLDPVVKIAGLGHTANVVIHDRTHRGRGRRTDGMRRADEHPRSSSSLA